MNLSEVQEDFKIKEQIAFIKDCVKNLSGDPNFDSKSRELPKPYIRRVFMALCKDHTFASLKQIGNECGNRNHSTVLNALRRYKENINKPSFEPYKKLYLKVSSLIEPEAIDVGDNEILSLKMRSPARVRMLEYMSKQKVVVDQLKNKLDAFRHREVFHHIAMLDEEDLNDFEERAKAFLSMKRIKGKYNLKIA